MYYVYLPILVICIRMYMLSVKNKKKEIVGSIYMQMRIYILFYYNCTYVIRPGSIVRLTRYVHSLVCIHTNCEVVCKIDFLFFSVSFFFKFIYLFILSFSFSVFFLYIISILSPFFFLILFYSI